VPSSIIEPFYDYITIKGFVLGTYGEHGRAQLQKSHLEDPLSHGPVCNYDKFATLNVANIVCQPGDKAKLAGLRLPIALSKGS